MTRRVKRRPRDTGERCTLKCDPCGKNVSHIGYNYGQSKIMIWIPVKHKAGCGYPCRGGGVTPEQFEEGYHGSPGGCPGCTALLQGLNNG